MNDLSLLADNARLAPRLVAEPVDAQAEDAQREWMRRYVRIALRWKWLIASVIALALVAGILVTILATPIYTGSTRIEINREESRVVNVDDVQPETTAVDTEFYQTQYGILTSRTLAERVARELRLAEDRRFFETFDNQEALDLLQGSGRAPTGPVRGRLFQIAVDMLVEELEVEPIRLSRLVDINWSSPDPDLSARVANAWANSFVRFTLERRFEQTSYARRFLEERLGQLRRRLEESERQLVGYASQQAIVNIPAGTTADGTRTQERPLVAETLSTLNAELAEATGDRVRAESRLQTGGGSGASVEALGNPAISSLRARRAEAAAEYSRVMAQFEPGYPPAAALAAQIQQLDRSIQSEEGRVQNSFRNAYGDSVRREQELRSRVNSLTQDFLDQRRRSIQYNIFQREVDTNRELYDGLLQRYKEIGVAGGVSASNVSIVDPARLPERPSYPRPLINLLIALLAGVVAGLALALIREQIDESIGDPSDFERRIEIPLLGAIPATTSTDLHSDLRDPKSNLVEAYLSVQTSLTFTTDHGIPRTLAVTSTRPGEGKSTTAYALAHSLARTGSRTILIDGDMRSPSVHGNVGIANELGLSNYLSGTEQLSRLIVKAQREPFDVLTAGQQPPNAAELLRNDRFPVLLRELLHHYQHVIIDCPPVMGLADAPLIASTVEATVYVVEAGGVKARTVRIALARLKQSRSGQLGAILTKFEAKKAHYGYGYDYGYGYGSQEKGDAAR